MLTAGHATDVSALVPVPPNVHVEAWVPQADVLAGADAVVCHGGSGTTFGALAAGLPLVVIPFFADQPANARLVSEAGAGLVVSPSGGSPDTMPALGPDDVPRIRAAVESVLADPSYRTEARRLADEMRALPTIDSLLDTLATG
nr:nucleotide disphospho-sugar-binding domain-containing protein [Streptomyces sp. SID4917]